MRTQLVAGQASAPRAGAPGQEGTVSTSYSKPRGQLCGETVWPSLCPPGAVSVEPEAWGEEVLSVGSQGKAGASSAAGAGRGGREPAGGEDRGPGAGSQVEEELRRRLQWEESRLDVCRAAGSFPRRCSCVLGVPVSYRVSFCSVFSSC